MLKGSVSAPYEEVGRGACVACEKKLEGDSDRVALVFKYPSLDLLRASP
jgi:hypothetical protein